MIRYEDYLDESLYYDEKQYSRLGFLLMPAAGLLLYVSTQKPKENIKIEPKIEDVRSRPKVKKDSVNIQFYLEVIKHQMIAFEGGYSSDENDPGNYYRGKLIGTKHGITASLALRLGLSEDSLKNLTIDDAARLLMDYTAKDINFKNSSKDFLLIYSLYSFYYGNHRADYFICKYYGLEPNAYNARDILQNKDLDTTLAQYLRDKFELLLINSFINDLNRPYPLYSFGWYRRYVSVLDYWKKQGETTLEPTNDFKTRSKEIFEEIIKKREQVSSGSAIGSAIAIDSTQTNEDDSISISEISDEGPTAQKNAAPNIDKGTGQEDENEVKQLSNHTHTYSFSRGTKTFSRA